MSVLEIPIAASADDAYENGTETDFSYTAPILRLRSTIYGNVAQLYRIGLRFQIPLPAFTDVTAAHIRFRLSFPNINQVSCVIAVERAADPVNFYDDQNIDSRQWTSGHGGTISWDDNDLGENGRYQWVNSPDISSLVNYQLAGGWEDTYHMVFFFFGLTRNPGRSVIFDAYDAHSSQAPILVLEYPGQPVEMSGVHSVLDLPVRELRPRHFHFPGQEPVDDANPFVPSVQIDEALDVFPPDENREALAPVVQAIENVLAVESDQGASLQMFNAFPPPIVDTYVDGQAWVDDSLASFITSPDIVDDWPKPVGRNPPWMAFDASGEEFTVGISSLAPGDYVIGEPPPVGRPKPYADSTSYAELAKILEAEFCECVWEGANFVVPQTSERRIVFSPIIETALEGPGPEVCTFPYTLVINRTDVGNIRLLVGGTGVDAANNTVILTRVVPSTAIVKVAKCER